MPAYEYTCRDCGKDFTVYLSVKDYGKAEVKCGNCGSSNVERKISGFYAQTSKKS